MTAVTEEQGETWCILRTAPSRTLRLAASLDEAGFRVWTPVECKTYRAPRSTAMIERTNPIMPTFVFADADRLGELLMLSKAFVMEHPDFSVFRFQGRAPIIRDASLATLRQVEQRAAAAADRRRRSKVKRPAFRQGEDVRVPGGPFQGMSGRVEQQRGKFVVVCFDRMTITVDAWQVVPDSASNAHIAA